MEKLKNLKVKKVLLIGFGTIILISVLIVGYSMSRFYVVSKNIETMYNQPYKALDLVWSIRRGMVVLERELYKGITIQDSKKTEELLNNTKEVGQGILDSIDELEQIYHSQDKLDLLEQIKEKIKEGSQIRINISEDILANRTAQAYQKIESQYEAIYIEASDLIMNLFNLMTEDAQVFVKDSKEQGKAAILVNAIFLIIGIIIAIIITGVVTRIVLVPLKLMVNVVKEMSKGNLNVKVEYESKNAFGELADSMRDTIRELKKYIEIITNSLGQLAEKNMDVDIKEEFLGDFFPIKKSILEIISFLNEMIYGTRESSNQVSVASNQIAQVAQNLAGSSTSQASTTQELSATVQDVTIKVENNAKNAARVNEITSNSEKEIEDGNTYMQNLLEAMNNINQQSQEIAKIIKLINNIASQTNLLSLNASIEAARAGEHGKGFAVVASEIGTLAEECGEAAKDTERLIKGSLSAVENGYKLAEQTANVLNNIVSSVVQTSNLVDEIAKDSNKQAEALEAISEGVNEVAKGVSIISETAEESSSASEELLSQAQSMTELLKAYKIKQ